jgi:hypothetical protein
VEIENKIRFRECRGSKFSRSSRKSRIGQLAIEAENSDEDYKVFIAILSFNLQLSDSRKNFGDSAEKAKTTEREAKNRGGGRGIIESSHESGGNWEKTNARQRIGERIGKTREGGRTRARCIDQRRIKVNFFRR